MNLPLTAYPQNASPLYSVRDACGVRIASDLSEEDAGVIVTACNAHAGLAAYKAAMSAWTFRPLESQSIGISQEISEDEHSYFEVRHDDDGITGRILFRLVSAMLAAGAA